MRLKSKESNDQECQEKSRRKRWNSAVRRTKVVKLKGWVCCNGNASGEDLQIVYGRYCVTVTEDVTGLTWLRNSAARLRALQVRSRSGMQAICTSQPTSSIDARSHVPNPKGSMKGELKCCFGKIACLIPLPAHPAFFGPSFWLPRLPCRPLSRLRLLSNPSAYQPFLACPHGDQLQSLAPCVSGDGAFAESSV